MQIKLYTEEQVIKMLGRARLHSHDDSEMFTDEYLISCETPIELPSDEDLDKWIVNRNYQFSKVDIQTTKWVIEQIKQQDK